MKALKTAVMMFFIITVCQAQQKFTFAVGDVTIDTKPVSDWVKLVNQPEQCMSDMLLFLEKYTTMKVDKEVKIVTFKKVEDIEKYPLIMMSANGPVEFSDLECKNMAEYCKRGGFIFIDDCVHKTSSLFFQSFKGLIEKKIFPGRKARMLTFDHEIYHCHFDLPAGLPYVQGEAAGGWAITDEKGRIMIFLSPTDIHCGWKTGQPWTELATKQSFQFMANLVIYSMTH